MTTRRPLKTVLLVVCLVGFPIVAFWLGWNLLDAANRVTELRSQSRFNHLALALQLYHDDYGAFPPTKYQPVAGGPVHSWRVLLVAQTQGHEVYSQYDFSKKWSSTNNLQALNGWPSRSFRFDGEGDTTHYLAIGEGDEWPSSKPLRSRLVTKGKDRFLLGNR